MSEQGCLKKFVRHILLHGLDFHILVSGQECGARACLWNRSLCVGLHICSHTWLNACSDCWALNSSVLASVQIFCKCDHLSVLSMLSL